MTHPHLSGAIQDLGFACGDVVAQVAVVPGAEGWRHEYADVLASQLTPLVPARIKQAQRKLACLANGGQATSHAFNQCLSLVPGMHGARFEGREFLGCPAQIQLTPASVLPLCWPSE